MWALGLDHMVSRHINYLWFANEQFLNALLFFSLSDAGALADPALEERGFPPDILMEEMIPTLKLVIRAVRSGTFNFIIVCATSKLTETAFRAFVIHESWVFESDSRDQLCRWFMQKEMVRNTECKLNIYSVPFKLLLNKRESFSLDLDLH